MNRYIISIFVLFIFTLTCQAAELRNWTGSNGKTIEAEFVSYDEDNEIVVIKKSDGKELRVKLSLFSDKDQEFVKSGGKEKTEDPFGGEVVTEKETVTEELAKPNEYDSRLIDIKFCLDEAKKQIDILEKTYPKSPNIGNLPSVYADFAFIQKLAGQSAESKKSFDTALKLNEGITDENDPQYGNERWSNYRSIMSKAIDADVIEIAEKIKDVTKEDSSKYVDILCILIKKYVKDKQTEKAETLLNQAKEIGELTPSLAVCQLLLGHDADAKLIAATVNKANTLQSLGSEYVKMGKLDKATEMFSLALNSTGEGGNTWIAVNIANSWIEADKIDEAKKCLNQITDNNAKASFLRQLAEYYFLKGDKTNAKNAITEAIILPKMSPYVRNNLALTLWVMNDLALYRNFHKTTVGNVKTLTDTPDWIPGGGNFTARGVYLIPVLQQEMFLEGTPSIRETIDYLEREVKARFLPQPKADESFGWAISMWYTMTDCSLRLGGTRYFPELLPKVEYFSKLREKDADYKAKDNEAKVKDTKRLERLKNKAYCPNYEYVAEIREGIPLLVKSGQIERVKPILQRIKLPQAKIYTFRLIAEELQKQNKP